MNARTDWAHCVPTLGEVVMVPADGILPGFHLFLAAPLEYLDAALANEVCINWDHIRASELYWIRYTVERLCQESRWYHGGIEDLDLLAGIKLRQELGK
jgi:hypothetical protein